MSPRPATSRRRAVATQADTARAIRAAQAAGLTIPRIVVRPEGTAVETADALGAGSTPADAAPRKRIKL